MVETEQTDYEKTRNTAIGVGVGLIVEALVLWYLMKLELWGNEKKPNRTGSALITGSVYCLPLSGGTTPVSNVTVTATSNLGTKVATTDSSGQYAISVPTNLDSATQFSMTFEHPQYTPPAKSADVTIQKGALSIKKDMSMGPCWKQPVIIEKGTLQVKTTLKRGNNPVLPLAQVNISSSEFNTAQTDNAGSFSTDVPVGSITVTASSQYGSFTKTATITKGGITVVTFDFVSNEGTLQVKTTLNKGGVISPLPQVDISSSAFATVKTDNAGLFQIVLPIGNISVTATTSYGQTKTAVIVRGQTTVIIFEFEWVDPARQRGTLIVKTLYKAAGATTTIPIGGVKISLSAPGVGGITASSGDYGESLQIGNYNITAVASKLNQTKTATAIIVLSQTTTVTIIFEGTSPNF